MTTRTTILALCPALATAALAQWTAVPGTQPGALNGVAAQGGGYLGISSVLYRSDDAGGSWTSWTPQIAGLPILGIMRDAHYVSGPTMIMAGSLDFDNQYGILRSTNGGLNWTLAYESSSGNWPRHFNDIEFVSSTTGYAVGSNGRIVRTTNGGQSWTALNQAIQGNAATSVVFFNESVGLVAGRNLVARTADAASSWTTTLNYNPGTGYMARNAAGLVGVASPNSVHLSNDQGLTWSAVGSPAALPVGIAVIDAQRFLVIEAQNAWFSTSGGAHWERADLPAGVNLRDVHFLDADHGCIVGTQDGNGLILVTQTGLGSGFPVASLSGGVQQAFCGRSVLGLSVSPVATSTEPGLNRFHCSPTSRNLSGCLLPSASSFSRKYKLVSAANVDESEKINSPLFSP